MARTKGIFGRFRKDYVATVIRGVEDFGFQGSKLQCEPGRALAVDGCSILTQVHLRKDRTLYINDGIFGTLPELVYLKLRVKLRAFREGHGTGCSRFHAP